MSTGGGAGLRDESGCLTEHGIAALRGAPPGKAPQDLAIHVAGCGRCQERLLGADAPPRPRGASPRSVAPSLGRTLLLAALLMATMLFFLYTLKRLSGP